MKKFTVLFLIFLCLINNIFGLKSVFAATNIFTQGIYKVSDFNPSKDNTYVFSNTSSKEKIYIIILDENLLVMHSIRLQPKSEKHITVPILPNYRVVMLGEGEVYFTPTEPA